MGEERTAVVTGAGSGLGREIARALLDAGYRVALAGRRPEPLQETARGAATALAVPTDVGDPDSVAALFDRVRDEWGRLDLAVSGGRCNAVDQLVWVRSLVRRSAGVSQPSVL
ncbi:SDR family oxidoreductase, partial [Saccharopolyspora hordei]|uniref:SDR family oxidoreductase n=1 Tax=Saccharopolyspora hordei TaxID=1838 RepID=UPI0035ECBAAF